VSRAGTVDETDEQAVERPRRLRGGDLAGDDSDGRALSDRLAPRHERGGQHQHDERRSIRSHQDSSRPTARI
jgi:hypothetical protein